MTARRGIFVAPIGTVEDPIGTTPIEARAALAGLFEEQTPGVPRSGVLHASQDQLVVRASATSYTLKACTVVKHRTANEGVYVFSFAGDTSVATDPAPSTDSRWDLIYVMQSDPEKSDPNGNDSNVYCLKGTAAAAPVKPTGSLPAGALVIAESRVYNTAQAGSNFITNNYPWAALRGAPIKVRNGTELAEITPSVGKLAQRLDQGGMLYGGTGAAWRTAASSPKKYAEVVGLNKSYTAGVAGPGTFTIDDPNSQWPDFIQTNPGGARGDVINIVEPGVYTIDMALTGNNASPIANGSSARITNDDQSGTYKEASIGNGIVWSDGLAAIVRAPSDTTPANPFFVRCVMDFRGNWAGRVRLRIIQE